MRNKRILLSASLLFVACVLHAQNNRQFLYEVGIRDSIHSKVLNESREFYVQLPASFDPESKRRYPVAYVLDGDVLLPAVTAVHESYYGGFMPEMILIGVSNGTNRTRDLTISKNADPRFNEESGGAAKFFSFLEEELIPLVESQYPVMTYRTLIGHSYGGLFTIYAMINHTNVFANYLAIDPSLEWNDQELLKQVTEGEATGGFGNKALFMSLSGQLHMQDPNVNIENVMQDSSAFTQFSRSIISFANWVENHDTGLFFEWKFYPRDLHGTVPLPSTMDGLIALFDWFQMENIDKINSPDTPVDELNSVIKYRAEKLKNHFDYTVAPYPEDLLNVLGYMSLEREQIEKSKMFFEFCMEYYPESPNGYDSMADFYESQDDKTNALKYVTKAYELSGSEYHKERMQELAGNE